MNNEVILKKGREIPLYRGHPWIFSGAIKSLPECAPGTIFPIYTQAREFLGQGYFHPDNSLSGRLLTSEKGDIETILSKTLSSAIALREALFQGKQTSAYRLINAEGDGFPGLIVDRYGEYLVVQIHTQGMERLKPFLVAQLITQLSPKGIYEKSLSPSRTEEGLPLSEGLLHGEVPPTVEVLEEGKKFAVSIPEGQKTGFFLDQREMRKKVESLAMGRKVLNAFSYTGGFGIYALKGGAESVTSVDRCKKATCLARENTLLNDLSEDKHTLIDQDLFAYLDSSDFPYDFVILDPPAFVKKRSSLDRALKAYQNLNENILKRLPPSSFLLTCSCSYHVQTDLFLRMVQTAAQKAGRTVQILSTHVQASDHPILLSHPEGAYLKSLLLFVQ